MKLNTLKVGDVVGVAREGRSYTFSQGPYTVIAANKVRIELERDEDGYVRTFSVKTGLEKSKITGQYIDNRTFIESMDVQDLREARLQAAREREQAWDKVAQSATRRNISELKQAIADLELLTEMA